MWFKAISGLKVNLKKSDLLPMGEVPNGIGCPTYLGAKKGRLPKNYLGLPLETKYKSKLYGMS